MVGGFEVTFARDERAFAAPEWARMAAADPSAGLFESPTWHRVWWSEFGGDRELTVAFLQRDGATVGIIPLYTDGGADGRVLRLVGGIELTDYLGPICAPEDRPAMATALVELLLSSQLDWDRFDGHNLSVPGGFAEPFVEAVDRAGLDYSLEQEETAAILTLPPTFEDYLASLPGKQRHELKRKRRKIAREHPDVSVRTASEETLDVDLKNFIAMHRGADGHKGHFMSPSIAGYFERLAEEFWAAGQLRLDLLEIGGVPIASTFGFEVGRTFYLYNSAFEPDYRHVSPGFVLVSNLIEDAIERGLATFDFLRGPERYKYQLGAEAIPLNQIRVLAPRTAGGA